MNIQGSALGLLFFLVLSGILSAQDDDKFKDKGLVINIDLDKSERLYGNNFGFPIDHVVKPILESDTALLSIFDQLEPSLMRFPAGPLANFMTFSEEGLRIDPSYRDIIRDSVELKRMEVLSNIYAAYDSLFTGLLAYLAEKHINLQFVANLYSADTSSFRNAIKLIKENQVNLVGVEMGYGLYQKAYKDKFEKPEDYVEKASAYDLILSEYFDDAPVGLCISPLKKYLKDPFDQENSKWNSRLSNSSFNEAWVLPLSYEIGKKCEKKGDIDRIYDCVVDEFIDYMNKDLPEYYLELKELFGREVWVSQFGLGDHSEIVQNSFLEANISFDIARTFIEQNLRDTFRITRYFSSKTYDTVAYRSLFSRKELIEKEVDNGEMVYRRAAYYPIYFLQGISNQYTDKLIASGASNIPNLIKSGKVSFSGFYSPEKLTANFYMTNKSDIPLKLDAIYFKGRVRYRGSTGKVELFKYSAGEWYNSIGVNAWIEESKLYDNSELELFYSDNKAQPRNFIVPPKSIYYIRIKVK